MTFRRLCGRVPGSTACLAIVGLLVGSCSGSSLLPPSDGILAVGTWGGDNSGVIVTDSVVHVHVGCTFGDMPGHVPLDQEGRFTVDGSYVLRAYPIQLGPSLPAQFSGRVSGRTLTLAIAVGADEVRFLINGTEVARQPRSKVDTDGTVGLRVNHQLDLRVDGLSIEKK